MMKSLISSFSSSLRSTFASPSVPLRLSHPFLSLSISPSYIASSRLFHSLLSNKIMIPFVPSPSPLVINRPSRPFSSPSTPFPTAPSSSATTSSSTTPPPPSSSFDPITYHLLSLYQNKQISECEKLANKYINEIESQFPSLLSSSLSSSPSPSPPSPSLSSPSTPLLFATYQLIQCYRALSNCSMQRWNGMMKEENERREEEEKRNNGKGKGEGKELASDNSDEDENNKNIPFDSLMNGIETKWVERLRKLLHCQIYFNKIFQINIENLSSPSPSQFHIVNFTDIHGSTRSLPLSPFSSIGFGNTYGFILNLSQSHIIHTKNSALLKEMYSLYSQCEELNFSGNEKYNDVVSNDLYDNLDNQLIVRVIFLYKILSISLQIKDFSFASQVINTDLLHDFPSPPSSLPMLKSINDITWGEMKNRVKWEVEMMKEIDGMALSMGKLIQFALGHHMIALMEHPSMKMNSVKEKRKKGNTHTHEDGTVCDHDHSHDNHNHHGHHHHHHHDGEPCNHDHSHDHEESLPLPTDPNLFLTSIYHWKIASAFSTIAMRKFAQFHITPSSSDPTLAASSLTPSNIPYPRNVFLTNYDHLYHSLLDIFSHIHIESSKTQFYLDNPSRAIEIMELSLKDLFLSYNKFAALLKEEKLSAQLLSSSSSPQLYLHTLKSQMDILMQFLFQFYNEQNMTDHVAQLVQAAQKMSENEMVKL